MEMNPNQPQNQTKVPPPPTPEVSVRTMQSDINSIAQGEITPTPEIVAPTPNFDSREQSFVPESSGPMLTEEAPAPKSHRKMWGLISVVIVIALAAVGYFVILPMMNAPVAEPIVTETSQPATPVPVIAPTIMPHTSAFSGTGVIVPQIVLKLETLSRETIIQSLTDQGALLGEGLTEVIFQDATGGQISFPTFITTLLPSFLDGQSANAYTEDDFTAYIHKDALGVWPGYVITLKAEGGTTLSQWLASFEKADLSAFFVTPAGSLGAFKDGTVKGLADRFATGVTPGSSLSYAVTETSLHISTSYEGLKAALTTLGY